MKVRTTRLPAGSFESHPARRAGTLCFERDGAGFAGLGEALRIQLPHGLASADAASLVAAAFAAFDVEDDVRRPGTGPVAFGALPFDASAPGSLVVPALLVARGADGAVWETEVVGADVPAVAPPSAEPHGFDLRAVRPAEEWCGIVDEAVSRIRAGALRKVVLAREVTATADFDIVVSAVVERLRRLFPSCTTFSVDGFVGASPERLVERSSEVVTCHPLAGTRARSGDPEVDRRVAEELLASAKDRFEHKVVVDQIADALRPLCTDLDVPDAPSVVPLRNVVHLGTWISGRLAEPAPSIISLGSLLHPTPAVAGDPTPDAVRLITELEGLDRGRYAGPVGWVDANGDGEFVVGIRAAEIDGPRARMLAGVGIVDGSVADDELAETQLKLQTMLAAVVRP